MKRKYEQQFGGDLRILSSCPLCGERYKQHSASIIDEQKDTFLIHVQCSNCKSSVVSSMVSGKVGSSSIGLITDLTSDDVLKFRNSQAVSSDDVLDLHDALKKDKIRFSRTG